MFIAIYGINNIGKSYHSNLLVERLNGLGRCAVYVKYPIYSLAPSGPFLNRVLRSSKKQKLSEEELQLWFVLNRCQFEPELKRMLAEGKIVIAEDYVGTGLAWGAAKGSPLAALESMNKFLVQPNVAILMDGERKLSSKEEKHIHESDDLLMGKCRKVYLKLAKKYGWEIVKVDKEKSVTAERIWNVLHKHLI